MELIGARKQQLAEIKGGGFTHADVNVVDQNAESREDLCKRNDINFG